MWKERQEAGFQLVLRGRLAEGPGLLLFVTRHRDPHHGWYSGNWGCFLECSVSQDYVRVT